MSVAITRIGEREAHASPTAPSVFAAPGPGRRQRDAEPARRAGVAVGGVGRGLLVAHADEPDRRRPQRLPEREVVDSGQAEADLHARPLELFDDDLRASGHGPHGIERTRQLQASDSADPAECLGSDRRVAFAALFAALAAHARWRSACCRDPDGIVDWLYLALEVGAVALTAARAIAVARNRARLVADRARARAAGPPATWLDVWLRTLDEPPFPNVADIFYLGMYAAAATRARPCCCATGIRPFPVWLAIDGVLAGADARRARGGDACSSRSARRPRAAPPSSRPRSPTSSATCCC